MAKAKYYVTLRLTATGFALCLLIRGICVIGRTLEYMGFAVEDAFTGICQPILDYVKTHGLRAEESWRS